MYQRLKSDGTFEYAYIYTETEDFFVIDGSQNLKQVAGTSEQYDRAAELAREMSKDFGDIELTFVGHSMGGGFNKFWAAHMIGTVIETIEKKQSGHPT